MRADEGSILPVNKTKQKPTEPALCAQSPFADNARRDTRMIGANITSYYEIKGRSCVTIKFQ